MRQRGVGIEPFVVGYIYGVDSIREDLFLYAFELAAYDKGFELAVEAGSQRTTFGEQFEADIGDDAVFYFAIYNEIIHFFLVYMVLNIAFIAYPMVWLAMSSFISSSISASVPSRRLLSLAWNMTFSTAFTLVGEPARPTWLRSALTSLTLHSAMFR